MWQRALADCIGIAKKMPIKHSLSWFMYVVLEIGPISRTRKFYAADDRMHGIVSFKYHGKTLSFDLSELPPRAFAWLREFFIRDNYFGAFNIRLLPLRNCVDLGCNIGLVSKIIKMIGGERVLAVDADDYSKDECRRIIAARNDIIFIHALVRGRGHSGNFDRSAYLDFVKKYGDRFHKNGVTITGDQILVYFIGKRIDFVKIDIEGAEFDILTNDVGWLHVVDNLALEVHTNIGNPADIIANLQRIGFRVAWKGNHADRVEAHAAEFIYASQTGLLKHPTV